MKKINLFISVILFLGIALTSCNDAKKEAKKEESTIDHGDHKHKKSEEVAMAHYQCPMKCEGEKTYDKPGSCPVCKMDLKEVEAEANHKDKGDNDEHKEHDDD